MATKTDANDDMHEACSDCGRETPHSVSIELRTESTKRENAEFSREPYRVSMCRVCGTESALRMNNA